jgi:hypothetical protein
MQSRFLRTLVEKYHSLKKQGVATAGNLPTNNCDLNADADSANQVVGTVSGKGNNDGDGDGDEEAGLDEDLNLNFTNDKWESLFTDTGFWMSEGIFLNDSGVGNGNSGS